MIDPLYQLIILFFVIFDPFASFILFTVATKNMKDHERKECSVFLVKL
ncbi:hypothetical protein HYY69_02095 [Candidatus Woesearchaeota archaeon]|nr:hypothetical protein [Candidatus Woesearchaeota archaeon]